MSQSLDVDGLTADVDRYRRDHAALVEQGLKLDLTRGKPSPEQVSLADAMLTLPGDQRAAADGTDVRNYGGPAGLPELRAIVAEGLQVPVAQLLAAGNSSLELMHDTLVHALLSGVPGGNARWVDGVDGAPIRFLCPVPGYDRHFALCERFGIEMITVPMTPDGPDLDVVERLVAEDPRIKGIWCVPKYSNPDGVVYSDDTVRRLAAMPTAAPDFRLYWDNAYAVHHLTDTPVPLADVLALAAEAGNPDRPLVFGSTSKITFAGAGVSFLGGSAANVAWFSGFTAKRTIGPDKVNQLRHSLFLRDADGLREHMDRHRALLAPKFAAVDRILREELDGIVTWTTPLGGYFVSMTVPDGCAKRTVALAKEAGVALTPAGATHPYGDDPTDSVIRLAPTFPSLADVEATMRAVAVCVRLAVAERAA